MNDLEFKQEQDLEFKQEQFEEPVTVKEWLITMLLLCIPIANIILMFYWAFGGEAKKSKSNYFKASLIMAAIVIVVYIVLFILFFSTMTSIFKYSGY